MLATKNVSEGTYMPDVGSSIEAVIADAEAEKEFLEKRILEDKGRIETLDWIISTGRRQRSVNRRGVMPASDNLWDWVTKDHIKDMSLKEVLRFLGRENGNIVKGLGAVRVVMRTGIISDRRSADAQVYTVLNREKDTFLKLEPGIYQVIDDDVEDLPF